MEINKKEFWYRAFLIAAFFTAMGTFLGWLEARSDFPHTDEYQSILSALGFPVYTPDLYVTWLKNLTHFADNFKELVRLNFVTSHLFLASAFFLFHWKKGLSLSANFTMTALLSLSTINVALTRKMHFWAAGFFFLILFLAESLEGRKKNIFMICSLIALGFFRREFFLCAAAAAALLAGRSLGKKAQIAVLTGGALAALGGMIFFGYGMKELLRESFQLQSSAVNPFSLILVWIKLFFTNAGLHLYYSFSSIVSTLRLYYPGVAASVAALAFFVFKEKRLKENALEMKTVLLRVYGPFFLPAFLALYSVRFMDFYVVSTFVLLLSVMAFLLNSRFSVISAACFWIFLVPAFFLMRPEFRESTDINFPTYRRGELVHRKLFDLIEKLDVKPGEAHYKILVNQYIAGVLPFEGREYFMFSDLKEHCNTEFDIVLLPGSWFITPEENLLKSCVRPRLASYRLVKIAPGYDLYLGPRISEEKFPLK